MKKSNMLKEQPALRGTPLMKNPPQLRILTYQARWKILCIYFYKYIYVYICMYMCIYLYSENPGGISELYRLLYRRQKLHFTEQYCRHVACDFYFFMNAFCSLLLCFRKYLHLQRNAKCFFLQGSVTCILGWIKFFDLVGSGGMYQGGLKNEFVEI